MTGSGLMDFLINSIVLVAVIVLFFYAIDFIAKDETFRKIGRLVVGVVALVVFLIAIKGVLFGGAGGGPTFTPVNLFEFAIGLLVILVVLFIINRVIDYFQAPFAAEAQYVIGAIALIALLVIAERALFGGGLGMHNFRLK